MKLPTQQEAWVYFMRAIDTPYIEIAASLKLTVQQVRLMHQNANNAARMHGLSYRFTPWMDTTKKGSGSTEVAALVENKPTQPLRGFELLKAMAMEVPELAEKAKTNKPKTS
jgi:hypothetical protein